MSSPEPPPLPPPFPSAESTDPSGPAETHVRRDVLCSGCGYALRGLLIAGPCPECGRPVATSLRGDDLCFASPEYLASLHRGVFIVQAALIATIVITMGVSIAAFAAAFAANSLNFRFNKGVFDLIFAMLAIGSAGVSAWGWWLLSEPDPSRRSSDLGQKARRLIRLAITVAVGAAVLQFAVKLGGQMFPALAPAPIPVAAPVPPPTGTPAGTAARRTVAFKGLPRLGLPEILEFTAAAAGFLAWTLQYFASMVYLRWLARRIPNVKAVARASQLMWLGPVLYIVLCVVIGPLIAIVLYYNLLDWIRRDLRRLRREQHDPAPPLAMG